jgi:hypothetical protein
MQTGNVMPAGGEIQTFRVFKPTAGAGLLSVSFG